MIDTLITLCGGGTEKTVVVCKVGISTQVDTMNTDNFYDYIFHNTTL